MENIQNDIWRNPDKGTISFKEIIEYIKDYQSPLIDTEIHIGTDSWEFTKKNKKVTEKYVNFTTAICIRTIGNGVKYFYKKHKEDKSYYKSLKARLTKEVEYSLEIASALRENDLLVDFVHVDANSKNPIYASYHHAKFLKNYVTAYGFDCELKPGAWAACAVADKYTR